MILHFAQRTLALPDLYAGYDDVPGLVLMAHLHGWEFPAGSDSGVANFRVELRQAEVGENPSAVSPTEGQMIGTGFVRATRQQVLEWRAPLPLVQALLDGLLGHEPVRLFFTQSAEQALQLPSSDPEGEPKQIPLSALKAGRNPFL